MKLGGFLEKRKSKVDVRAVHTAWTFASSLFSGTPRPHQWIMQIVHVFFVRSSTKFNFLIFTVMKTKFFLLVPLAIFLVAGVACSNEDKEPPFPENNDNMEIPDPESTVLVSVRNSVNGGSPVKLPELGEFYIDEGNNFTSDDPNLEFCSVGSIKGLGGVNDVPFSNSWATKVAMQERYGYFARHKGANGYKYARLYVTEYIMPHPNMILGAYVKYQSPYPIESDISVIIPDKQFKSFLIRNFDADSNGKLSQEEADSVRIINCCFQEIKSLDGIELFSNLEELYCNNNQLTTLDISENTELEILSCYTNLLPSLDISANRKLTFLACSSNPGNGTVFPVTAWFDNTNKPKNFPISYEYNGRTITIDYKMKE